MSCPDMDNLEAKFILVRSELAKTAMEGKPVQAELEAQHDKVLNEIMSHQVEHLDCDSQ